MPEGLFTIKGRVLETESNHTEKELRVEAWEKGRRRKRPIAAAVITDPAGRFTIEFSNEDLRGRGLDPFPDVFLKVYQDDRLLKSMEGATLWNLQPGQTKVRDITLTSVSTEGKPARPITLQSLNKKLNNRLPGQLLEALAVHGIRTLDDIPRIRDVRGVLNDDEDTGRIIDTLEAIRRLRILGIGNSIINKLLDSGVRSSADLARLSPREIAQLASKLHISDKDLAGAVSRAKSIVRLSSHLFYNTLLYHDGALKTWLSPGGATNAECGCCDEEASVISRFAYFIYLVIQSAGPAADGTIPELINQAGRELHQNLRELQPVAGCEPIPHIVLCNEVLARAYPEPLVWSDRMRAGRRLIMAYLTIVAMSTGQVVEELQRSGRAPAPTLAKRLNAALKAGLFDPAPWFSENEVDMVIEMLRKEAILGLEKQVTAEAGFKLAPGLEIRKEAERRLEQALRSAQLDVMMIHRDAYKARAMLSDALLFERYFIETNLDKSVMTTRIGQAIRSLQAYIDQKHAKAANEEERAWYTYQDYESWRVAKLSELYPELEALLRDEVLTAKNQPDGAWDRGSIIRNRSTARPALEYDLDQALKSLQEADFNLGSERKFINTEYYLYFLRGLDVIQQMLRADDLVQESLVYLDEGQPGLGLARLEDAQNTLQSVADLVFMDGSAWREHAQTAYNTLMALPPGERWLKLRTLRDELIWHKKAIFQRDQLNEISTLGLNLDTGLFENLNGWQVEQSFHLASPDDAASKAGKIIKDHGSGQSDRRCVYADGIELKDYTLTVDLELIPERIDIPLDNLGGKPYKRKFAMDLGEEFGLVARNNVTNKAGYKLVIGCETTVAAGHVDPDTGNFIMDITINAIEGFQEFTSGDEDIVSTVMNYFLSLQKVEGNGNSVELDRSDVFNIERDQNCKLEFSVKGSELKGAVNVNGQRYEVSSEDTLHSRGTFGLYASASLGAVFGPLHVNVGVEELGVPPFFAPRRFSWNNKNLIQLEPYTRHMEQGDALSADLLSYPLLYSSEEAAAEPLGGIVNGGQQGALKFAVGKVPVSLDALDTLLEKCLSLMFHLRFTVIPMRMAQAQVQSGDFEKAASLLTLLYDDSAPEDYRKICHYFTWPPQGVAPTIDTDTLLLRMRLGEIYLAWAQWLFRRNTDETRYQARRLCERVLALHQAPASCLREDYFARLREWLRGAFTTTPDLDVQAIVMQLFDIVTALQRACPPIEDLAGLINSLEIFLPEEPRALLDLLQGVGRKLRELLEQSGGDACVRRRAVDWVNHAGDVMLAVEDELINRLYLEGAVDERLVSGLGSGQPQAGQTLYAYFRGLCIPPNPLVERQLHQARLMLNNLLHCRNILGYDDSLVPPLRFEALLRAARSFTDLALAAERDLLNFRQYYESEIYSLLQAEKNLALAAATVDLEAMRVAQATSEVRIAALQAGQADLSVEYYENLIQEGLSEWEQLALASAGVAVLAGGAGALSALAGFGLEGAGLGVSIASGGTASTLGIISALAGLAVQAGGAVSSIGPMAGSLAQFAGMQASFERRAQDWNYQLRMGRYSAAITQERLAQMITLHNMAIQQQNIAGLEHRFACNTMQFLAHKFLNRAMWVWMQRVIREQYRRRLDYAIAASYMAERALAFECHTPMQIIRFDYFDPQRDGLLGATQLQTDLMALDNTRLSLTQRKLQLTKTISLTKLMPSEFERFRQGDALRFGTLMDMFDRDFPGHFMRLIKAVKVTVIALIPPCEGIRATLRNSGISQVMAGPLLAPTISELTVCRNPESVALSLPFQASGVFVLDYKDDLLLPFEGSGVATDWVFELPQAANRFDYRTIADVLFTIDYTALEGPPDYRQQVIRRLGQKLISDRVFSLRYHFSDAWYDLNNPELLENNRDHMTVVIETCQADFPPNVEELHIKEVLLYFVRNKNFSEEIKVDFEYLYSATDGQQNSVGGPARSSGGVISTRNPNGNSWTGMRDKPPIGQWRLKMQDIDNARRWFKEGQIEDILFVITFSGETPDWK